MAILSNLEPKRVFEIFEEMCAIPHGSTNTKAISDWCVAFGEKLGLEHYQDEANNVILIAPATLGYEDAPAVILQGHVDMVCEKEAGCAKDMDKEGLDLFVDGDLVGAKGTTLGGDDGIAVAMALAALEDTTVQHPRLEVVLTTDEEIGMLGAAVLDVTPLQGRTMLNIDSEEEGIFTVGCAGGSSVFCHLPLVREEFAGETLAVRVSGLVGGHSGVEINKGRANADVLLGRLLRAMSAATELRLVSAEGGNKDNAIPTAAAAVVTVADGSAARKAAETLAAELKKEYRIADPGLTVAVETVETKSLPMDEVTTGKALCMLTCLPNGVQAMSMDIPGLVQTSLNIGILKCGDDEMMAVCSVRSSVASQKQMVRDRLRCLTEQMGGRVDVIGDYPAWEYLPDSPLRERMIEVYREQYGKEPVVETIHAGLECGLLGEKLPGLDCVSFGPDLTDIHTPRERMHIASVQRTWKLLCEVLKRSK